MRPRAERKLETLILGPSGGARDVDGYERGRVGQSVSRFRISGVNNNKKERALSVETSHTSRSPERTPLPKKVSLTLPGQNCSSFPPVSYGVLLSAGIGPSP